MKLGLNLYNKLLASNNYKDVYISPCSAVVEVNVAASLAINNQSVFTYLVSHPQFNPYAVDGVVFIEAAKQGKLQYVNKWLHNADIKLVTGCLNAHMKVLSKDMMLTLIPKSNYVLEDYANMLLENSIGTLCEFTYSIRNSILLQIVSANNYKLLQRVLHNLKSEQINAAIAHAVQYCNTECYNILEDKSTIPRHELISLAMQYNNSVVLDKLENKWRDTVIILH